MLRVANLIDFDAGKWDFSGLESKLLFDVRDVILGFPLSKRWPADCLYWMYTKDGRYSVRTSYWLGTTCTNTAVAADMPIPYAHL